MSRRTGHARGYSRDPCGAYGPPSGYYARGSGLMFAVMNEDDRLNDKAIVVTAVTPDGPLAVAKSRLRERERIRVTIAGNDYLVTYDDNLDSGRVYRLKRSQTPPTGRSR